VKRTPMRSRYRDTGPDRHTEMAVLHRHGYRCARCDAVIVGERGLDWVLHHRRPRGAGGSSLPDTNSPANLIPLHGPGADEDCHGHVESHRAEALTFGWLVRQGADPASVPVLIEHGARRVLLDHDGDMTEVTS